MIDKILSTFCCGKESYDSFQYIGLNIEHSDDGLILHQRDYNNEIHALSIAFLREIREDKDELNIEEQTLLRELVGQFNWLSNQSRPDISYDVLELSMSVKNAKVAQIKQANKLVKRANGEYITIRFPCLGKPNEMRILLFSEAAYANLIDGVSSEEGYIIPLAGSNGRCCPPAWCYKKIRRVVKSTIASETLSMVDCLDMAMYLGCLLTELFTCDKCFPLDCYIDNHSLFDNIYSAKAVSKKRLRIDIASIKQMVDRGDISSVKWIPAGYQIADSFTKRGASCKRLAQALRSGHLRDICL